jgi:hypothetical protein
MTKAENEALAAALLWLKSAPSDDWLADVSFGRFSDGSGCWWTVRTSTEVRNGKMVPSRQTGEQKILAVIEAWRAAYQPAESAP